MQRGNGKQYFLQSLKLDYDEGILVVNDEYQRKFIWPIKFQRSLILSVFKNFPIGSLIIRTMPSGKNEIVDGQQRIKTIIRFIENKLSLNSTNGYDIYQIVKNKDDSEERKNYYSKIKSINKFSDLMKRDQRWLLTSKSINAETIEGNDEEIKEFFTLVQNQEKVKAGEITSNLPTLNIENFFNYEKLDEILLKIGFNNSRKEIVKLLIADFGYQNNLISLGSTDEQIIKFAKNIDQEKNSIKIDNLKKHIEKSILFLMRIDSKINGPAKKDL